MLRDKAEEADRLLKKIRICEQDAPSTLGREYMSTNYRELHRLALELVEELKDIYTAQLEAL